MKACVVDASVAIKWFVPEEHSDAARGLLARGRAGQVALHTPDIFAAEIGNVVWKKVRRRELSADDAWDVAAAILGTPMVVYGSRPLLPQALRIALATGRTVYDSLYLGLADSLGCPLVTADRRFRNAVALTSFKTSLAWIEDV